MTGADLLRRSAVRAGTAAPTLVLTMPGFGRALGARAAAVAVAPQRFANGELVVRLREPVAERACVLVGSVSPPDDRLAAFLLTADTLKRHGAAHVTAALPYLAYARQDRPEPLTSLAAEWLGRVLGASGVDAVLAVDAHSRDAARLLELPVCSLSTAELFARVLDATPETVVVAPDEGAVGRARALARALGCGAGTAWLQKRRDASGVRHTGVTGELRRHAIVVDDILDTGGTLVSCCRELGRRGVQSIDVAVTHGLFTGDAWRALLGLVRAIHVTDTVPDAGARAGGAARVHSIAPLLEAAVLGAPYSVPDRIR